MDEIIFNGDREGGYPGCINLSFAYVEGESLLMALKDMALSSGRYSNHHSLSLSIAAYHVLLLTVVSS
jgi:cysteine desulfurase